MVQSKCKKRMEVQLMKKDYSKLWVLFKSMFILSACTFGGGFVIVSLMKKRYVEELKWLEEDEMLDVCPGPLARKRFCYYWIPHRRNCRFVNRNSGNHPPTHDYHFDHLPVL